MMTMSEYEDMEEVEEGEIEAQVKERHFEVGESEVELEDVDGEESDYTGDREALVSLLIDINENTPVDIDFGEDGGDEAGEEEIEAVVKSRDPIDDLIYAGNMRDKTELFGEDEWEVVEPEEAGED